ncbi:MAG: bleomycin resistance protein [Cytophagales bacterium]
MKLVPTFRTSDFQRSLDFYTKVLGFKVGFMHKTQTPEKVVHFAGLERDGCELHLSEHGGDGAFGSVVYVRVDEVDQLFAEFKTNGLKLKSGSAVHEGPTNQTWGTREFYVTDPDGNTLRFGCLLKN